MTSFVFTFTKIVVFILITLNINFRSKNDTSLIFCNGYNIKYRTATSSDVSLARDILLQQTMNPFSVKDENLLIAYDADEIDDGISGVVGFGQIRPIDTTDDMKKQSFSELASLYVDPNYRRKGIASMIVKQLIERSLENQRNDEQNYASSTICLLTLRPTAPLYEKHGFAILSMDSAEFQKLPKAIKFEASAGRILSSLLRNDLVCMVKNLTN